MSTRVRIPFETTVRVRDHCLCLHAQRAARALARRFDEALRPVGLTNGQFSLLISLNRPEKPPSLGAIANLLVMDRTTLTASLKPLERRGLIQATADPEDRRTRLLTLTRAGVQALSRAVPIWERTNAQLEARLSAPGADAVRRKLRALW